MSYILCGKYINVGNGCMRVFGKKRNIKIHIEYWRMVLHTRLCFWLFFIHSF